MHESDPANGESLKTSLRVLIAGSQELRRSLAKTVGSLRLCPLIFSVLLCFEKLCRRSQRLSGDRGRRRQYDRRRLEKNLRRSGSVPAFSTFACIR